MPLSNIKKIFFKIVLGITVKKENDIKKFIKEVIKFLPKNTLIILFFDSTMDKKTYINCKQLEIKFKNRIHVILDKKANGLADAYFRLYKFCSNLRCDWFISMNAGWRHKPYDIKKFIYVINNKKVDCVWGYRKKNSANFFRKFVSYYGDLLSRYILGLNVIDATSGFYAIKANILKNKLKKIVSFKSKYHFFDTELKYYLRHYKYDQVKISYKSPNKLIKISAILDSLKVLFFLKILNY